MDGRSAMNSRKSKDRCKFAVVGRSASGELRPMVHECGVPQLTMIELRRGRTKTESAYKQNKQTCGTQCK
jgi:hypothetical protein